MFTRLRVPGPSSANLGPGFDALGLALGVYLTCRFRRSEALTISTSGRDADAIPATPTISSGRPRSRWRATTG